MPPIREIEQEILDVSMYEDLTFKPETVLSFVTSVFFQRSLAHLFAQYGSQAKRLQCTASGKLEVSSSSPAVEQYNVDPHTFVSDAAETETPGFTATHLDIFVWGNPVYFRWKINGGSYGDWIEVNEDSVYSFDAAVSSLEIKNKNSGFNARYQIVWWG